MTGNKLPCQLICGYWHQMVSEDRTATAATLSQAFTEA